MRNNNQNVQKDSASHSGKDTSCIVCFQNALFNFGSTVSADVAGQTKYFELSPDQGWKVREVIYFYTD